MGLAAFLVPPALEAKQKLRLRRFGLAALSVPLATAMVALAWLLGLLSAPAALQSVALMLALYLIVYTMIRTGWNQRFPDPSLTRFQILAAITLQMFIVYHMDDARNIALFGCFILFAFGFFRLDARAFRLLTLYTLAAYALVINLMMHFRPLAIRDVPLEWMSWLMLAGFLPFFTAIGVQINTLRRRLHDSTEKFRLFADNVPAMAVSYDENLRCRFANKAFCDYWGISADAAIGRHMRDIHGADVFTQIEGHARRVLQGIPVTYRRTTQRGDGEIRHLEVHLLPRIDARGRVLEFFGVTTDITEHKLAEEHMQRVAHHDSLTGLPNRLLFDDRLQQAISLAGRDKRQCALLYLDLTRFKAVNDSLGHAAGDTLLQEVAARIRQQVRGSDTVARIGGDEFAVILPNVAGRAEADIVAGKIVTALSIPFHVGEPAQRADIGTSIGIARYPADATDADGLVKAADAAMYAAKQADASRSQRAA